MACTSVDKIRLKIGLLKICKLLKPLKCNGKFIVKAKCTIRVKNFLKDGEKMFVKDLDICVYTQIFWPTTNRPSQEFSLSAAEVYPCKSVH